MFFDGLSFSDKVGVVGAGDVVLPTGEQQYNKNDIGLG